MPNLTSGKGTTLKISTPHPNKDNATRSIVITQPSFTKGERTKNHVIGTPYAVGQETTSKKLGFRSLGDFQSLSPINLAWELMHKYT
jgi:hypothetical protein